MNKKGLTDLFVILRFECTNISSCHSWFLDKSPSLPFCSLYRIIPYIKCNMLSKSSKWELGFVHYIAKFTISRFVISRFECTLYHAPFIEITKKCILGSGSTLKPWYNKPQYSEFCDIVNKTQLPFWRFTKHITFDIVNYSI